MVVNMKCTGCGKVIKVKTTKKRYAKSLKKEKYICGDCVELMYKELGV